MILNALVDYYDRLVDDPEQNVAPLRFSREKISYCIVLKPDGAPFAIQDIREQVEVGGKSKKTRQVPRPLIVPDRGGRSGTLIKPNFLFDNTGYVLGVDGKGKPERSRAAFEAFRELHDTLAEHVNDAGLTAVRAFLHAWNPDEAEQRIGELGGTWDEVCDANIVFRLLDKTGYVHESKALRDAWVTFADEETEADSGFSLVSGRAEPLARLHPMIRGVTGAQSSGAALVSFNLDAFESYNKEQSYNAPVGVGDAFRYTTALNRLVNDRTRRVRMADTTVLFWSDKPTAVEDNFLGFCDDSAADDQETVDRLKSFLDSARRAWLAKDRLEDADLPFYVLGLAPNASRLSVRFWLAGTVQEFAERIGRHISDLEIGGGDNAPPLTLRRLIRETAHAKNGWPDDDSISPLLSGAVLRSVLSGAAYPQALLAGVINRIGAEGFANKDTRNDWRDAMTRRAAILKAYLIRNSNQEIPVTLNKDHPKSAYQLGRLFAALEKTQEDAHGNKLNTTIKDHFFTSASATPAVAFGRLLPLHQHHLNKLRDKPGLRINRERLVQEIFETIEAFPAHLSLDDRGLFFIGYYHQRQDFFTSKTDETGNETTTSEDN